MQSSFVFDSVEPITVDVSIAGESYSLREAGAGVVAKYKNSSMRAAKFSDGKMSGIDGAASADPFLLSLCITKGGAPVPLDVVLAWPERIVKPLVTWIKDNSAMGDQTLAQLDAEIEVLQRRADELRKGGAAKNSLPPAEDSTS